MIEYPKMSELEMMYYDAEWRDIKQFCIKHGQMIMYRGKTFYLYLRNIYDADRNLIIEQAENGFLDLFEYYEYFEAPQL